MLNILAVCSNPGGVNAIMPVLANMLDAGDVSCHGLIGPWGHERFTQLGISFDRVTEAMNLRRAEAIIAQLKPDIILAGTSDPPDATVGRLEPTFCAAGASAGTPTVSVLDFWSGYRNRYSLGANGPLDALPDIICVMDSRAEEEMVTAGFPAERLRVTGNPHWDGLKEVRNSVLKRGRQIIRSQVGLTNDQPVVLFVSQPFAEDGRGGEGLETGVLNDLRKAVAASDAFSIARVLIKPHPREDPAKFAVALNDPSVNLCDPTWDSYDIGFASDVVVGISSMLLVELQLIGATVLSYQPGGALNPLGFGVPITATYADLERRFAKPPQNSLKSVPAFKAVQRVNHILRHLTDSSKTTLGILQE